MPRSSCRIAAGAALGLLLLHLPVADASPTSELQRRSIADEHRADLAQLPPRKRPTQGRSTASRGPGQLGCGQVIMKSTVLQNDVGPCAGDGIVVGADNLILNLNGHRVSGNADQGTGGEFAGIRLVGRTGVTVSGHPGTSGKTATVGGFEAGVVIDGGSANTVQNLMVRDNIGRDDFQNAELGDGIVVFDSPSNEIRNNVVIHNGIFDGIGVLGPTSDNNTVEGNTVDDTVGTADGGPAGQGIIVNGAQGLDPAVITGTKTVGNVVRRSASGGIANLNNTEAEIVGNTVVANGTTNVAGNGIGVQAGLGYGGPGVATHVLVAGNEVHKNAADGIQVRGGAHENRIAGNNAADNAVRPGDFGPFESFDLRDFNSFCDSNEWSGNVWGSGFYSPPCVTTGGRGPLLAPTPEGPFLDPSCFDGADNDQDGIIDGPYDPDCLPPIEGPEGDPNCIDGIDNDNDGLIDGNDPDCLPATAEGPAGDPTCSDLIDNDRDGLYDLRDPDCQSP